MSKPSARRGTLALAALAALLVVAFAAVPAAQASTLYACVTKSGTAHVFTKKPKKCKSKKEKLVSWNTSGPAGKNGTNGSNGSNGSNGGNGLNGAVAGYSATQSKGISFTNVEGKQASTLILSKTLPAGSYIVNGNVQIVSSQAGKNDQGETALTTYVDLSCTLGDTPTSGSGATSQTSFWSGLTNIPVFIVAIGDTNLSFNFALTTTASSTATITCTNIFNDGSNTSPSVFGEEASDAVITAVQTSSNS